MKYHDAPVGEPPVSATGQLTVKPFDMNWPLRQGIILTHLKAFECGLGSEYVYCYSYQTYLENAKLKQESRFRIKVGMATTDPVNRICIQIGGSKTAQAEPAQLLLIFKTLAARHLERWLHQRLERASDAMGAEWFITSPEEIIGLYREYVHSATVTQVEESSLPELQCATVARIRPSTHSKERGKRNADGLTNKEELFELWLAAAMRGEHLELEQLVKLFPNRSTLTLTGWISNWRHGGKNRGYPRVSFGRSGEIIVALENLYGEQYVTEQLKSLIEANTTSRRDI